MNETISVLIPVFNRENFIERSIQSILNQSYHNLEIIIYDDGSDDGTKGILADMMKNPKIIVITGGNNHGVGYARNRLLCLCITKYAIWQDSDDISHPKRIELQVEQMRRLKGPNLCYCGWENLNNKKPGTTRGFATLLFPVDKSIKFPENIKFGGEDARWREEMEKIYCTTDVNKVLYSIDFHNNRIGSWKRKIDKDWNGKYDLKDIEHLSYAEAIEKYKEEYGS